MLTPERIAQIKECDHEWKGNCNYPCAWECDEIPVECAKCGVGLSGRALADILNGKAKIEEKLLEDDD